MHRTFAHPVYRDRFASPQDLLMSRTTERGFCMAWCRRFGLQSTLVSQTAPTPRSARRQLGSAPYDDIHNAAAALAPQEGAPEDFDTTRFACAADAAESGVRALAASARAARQYIDTANFTMRCLVCQKGIVGESAARAHPKETGHTNFGEY